MFRQGKRRFQLPEKEAVIANDAQFITERLEIIGSVIIGRGAERPKVGKLRVCEIKFRDPARSCANEFCGPRLQDAGANLSASCQHEPTGVHVWNAGRHTNEVVSLGGLFADFIEAGLELLRDSQGVGSVFERHMADFNRQALVALLQFFLRLRRNLCRGRGGEKMDAIKLPRRGHGEDRAGLFFTRDGVFGERIVNAGESQKYFHGSTCGAYWSYFAAPAV